MVQEDANSNLAQGTHIFLAKRVAKYGNLVITGKACNS